MEHSMHASDADLLVRFLQGDVVAREALPTRICTPLRARAVRLAPDLARRGLIEEATQQFWLLLCERPAGWYQPGRAAPLTWLGYLLRTAIAQAREANGPVLSGVPAQVELVSLDAPLATGEDETLAVADTVDVEADAVSLAEAERIIDLGHQFDALHVGPALRLYAVEDRSFGEISSELQVDRFKLRRRLDRFAREIRSEAVAA